MEFVATRDLLIWNMASLRIVQMSACPLDTNQLIYFHCFDLSTMKSVLTAKLPCLEIRCVLGHFSFTEELNIREFVAFSGRQRVKRS